METVDASKYDLRRLHDSLADDKRILSNIWNRVGKIRVQDDAKLAGLKEILATELRGRKVLLFTYYKDTARYLYTQLGDLDNPDAAKFQKQLGTINVRRMDSDARPKDRSRIVRLFAPKSNDAAELTGGEKEIDVLISTDVLSEVQNLQDCGYLINYDLHWNPTRMFQRAGRIDRIGTEFDRLMIYNMFPDEGLERLLRLVEGLSEKIAAISRGVSGPSGEYHWYSQLHMPMMACAVILILTARNSPACTPSSRIASKSAAWRSPSARTPASST